MSIHPKKARPNLSYIRSPLVYETDRTCLRAVPMVVLFTLVANLNEQIDSP